MKRNISSILRKRNKEFTRRSRKGVTLAEMLVATMILMLSTLVIVQCVALASRHFVSQTREAEAQMLCSALTTAIQDELLYAQEIDGSGTSFTYFSGSRRQGQKSTLTTDGNGRVVVHTAGGEDYPLVEAASYAATGRRGGIAQGGSFFTANLETNLTGNRAVAVRLEIQSNGDTLSSADFTVRPLAPGAL